jgi:hypothetical protein
MEKFVHECPILGARQPIRLLKIDLDGSNIGNK